MSTYRWLERGDGSRKGEIGKYIVHNAAVRQVVMDVRFSLLLEGWYIVLKTISQRDTKHK